MKRNCRFKIMRKRQALSMTRKRQDSLRTLVLALIIYRRSTTAEMSQRMIAPMTLQTTQKILMMLTKRRRKKKRSSLSRHLKFQLPRLKRSRISSGKSYNHRMIKQVNEKAQRKVKYIRMLKLVNIHMMMKLRVFQKSSWISLLLKSLQLFFKIQLRVKRIGH